MLLKILFYLNFQNNFIILIFFFCVHRIMGHVLQYSSDLFYFSASFFFKWSIKKMYGLQSNQSETRTSSYCRDCARKSIANLAIRLYWAISPRHSKIYFIKFNMFIFLFIFYFQKMEEQYALVGIDCFSKLQMGSTTPWQSNVHYCDTLKKCFEQYGKPKQIHTDNSGSFVSQCKIFFKILIIIILLIFFN